MDQNRQPQVPDTTRPAVGSGLTESRAEALSKQLARLAEIAQTLEHDYPDLLDPEDRTAIDRLRRHLAVRTTAASSRPPARIVPAPTVGRVGPRIVSRPPET